MKDGESTDWPDLRAQSQSFVMGAILLSLTLADDSSGEADYLTGRVLEMVRKLPRR